ncbi:uncharacterized protein LOC117122117 [Anneissia japonica]|uniref:uncharacterized protein LOC117122117 n=1 Tax=Anneissia japonica TaxID=1529436 RepID=UPI001425B80E|nr:uncharacterized protein LOC117122117 [Anneissia japonica]
MEVRLSGYIQQVSVSRYDDIVLLTDSNQLYYSYAYSTSFLQLGACQLPDISSSVYFDVLSRLYTISLRNRDVLRRSYPLLTEVESALYPSFVRFESTFHPEIVHLDINEEVELKVHLIHSTSHADGIQVKVANSHLASLVVQDEMEFFPGIRGIFKTLKIAVNADFAIAYKQSDIQGIMLIEAEPQRAAIESYRPSRMVTQVAVGCPPDRHIRVVKPRTCDTIRHFIIPRSARQGEMTDTIVQYDFGTFGCPIESKHHQLFRPTLHL